jgi:ribosome maturation factor RimP
LSQLDLIQEIAGRIVSSEGLELVDIEYKPGKNRGLLRIFIDKEGGVTLSDCENVSRQLGTILDVEDVIKNAYVLEVSSPGLDRPMRTDRDYRRAIGYRIKATIVDDQGNSEQVTGKLLAVSDQDLVLEDRGKNRTIPRSFVKRAIQDLVLGQPKKNLKKR